LKKTLRGHEKTMRSKGSAWAAAIKKRAHKKVGKGGSNERKRGKDVQSLREWEKLKYTWVLPGSNKHKREQK